jgi:hypothetical protein
MNDNDKKLSEFFYDLDNLTRYKCNSPGLENFYMECEKILEDGMFTDINLQDERGNTYLHHISNKGKWDWFIKVTGYGGNPLIKNKNGRNAFQVCRSIDGIANFWRISSVRELESFSRPSWHEQTKKYHLEYKQYLFKGYLTENQYSFDSIDKIENFLKESQLENNLNKVALIAISNKIEDKDKWSWFEKNCSTKEENSEFFCNLMKQTLLVNKERTELLNTVLNLPMVQTEDTNKIIASILNSKIVKERDVSLADVAIKMMIEQNFDLNQIHNPYAQKKETLLSIVESNPENHKIYLDNLLSKENKISRKVKI